MIRGKNSPIPILPVRCGWCSTDPILATPVRPKPRRSVARLQGARASVRTMPERDLYLHISINAQRKTAGAWGDKQYAEGLIRALSRQGVGASLFYRDEAPDLTGQGDVILRITGPTIEEPIPGLPNLIWIISSPNVVIEPLLARYQRVFVASELMAARFREAGLGAENLTQATEPTHFHPDRRPAGAPDLPIVFVGAHAPRSPRRAVFEAIGAGLETHVWGPGWDRKIPARNWRGPHLDYDELAATYACARIVLNAHMPEMSLHGMMSNRSFDAIASGAVVVSDPVRGFAAPDLPELIQTGSGPGLVRRLAELLAAPPADHATRLERHARIAARYSFDAAALSLLGAAREALEHNQRAAELFIPRSAGLAPRLSLSAPEASAPEQYAALQAAAQEIEAIFAALEFPARKGFVPPPAVPPEQQGVLHPLMSDLRRVQDLALRGGCPEKAMLDIRLRARRVLEARQVPMLRLNQQRDTMLVHHMRGDPLFACSPPDHVRDRLKEHVALWPRRKPVALKRPLGVFLHLFYDELAPVFAQRLARIEAPMQVYISTDTEGKAAGLRRHFPQAEIRVLSNRGRDIWPKFYGFSDACERHDLVLHLHGKRSKHSDRLEEWLAHNLDCLLPGGDQINRILSLFRSIPQLGLIAPVVLQSVLPAAHWGANREIAEEIAYRLGWPGPLPGNDRLRFPVGSMFWARSAAIRPLVDLDLRPGHFPPECGQLDGTAAHAIERLVGVSCEVTGHRMLAVAPSGSNLYGRFKQSHTTNRALAAALIQDAADD